MPDFQPAVPRRAHGYQLPANFRAQGAGNAIQIVDIGGRAHVWDPREGVLINLESISERIHPEHYKGARP